MEIDIQKEFGSTLDKIWSDFARACAGTSINTSLPPAIVSHIEKNCDVLFIGMNPSVVAAQQQPKYYCPCTITIDYFKQLSKFCKEISLNSWGYLDMYPIRHTIRGYFEKNKTKRLFLGRIREVVQSYNL